MAIVNGNARRYDGDPVSFVVVFEWDTAEPVATIAPDSTGEWSFEPDINGEYGVTYLSTGCKPITHGPYFIEGKYGDFIPSGFLLLALAESGGRYSPELDKSDSNTATWDEYFSHVMDTGLLNYLSSDASDITIPTETKVIDQFNIDWQMLIYGTNATWGDDTHTWTLEFLNDSGNVMAAIKSEKDGTYRSGLWYGSSLSSLTKAGQYGSYPRTTGYLTFDELGIHYENTRGSNYNKSFHYSVDLSVVTKVRVSGTARSTYSGGGTAGGYIRIVPPEAV